MMRPPPGSTLFPRTTLFRSPRWGGGAAHDQPHPGARVAPGGAASAVRPVEGQPADLGHRRARFEVGHRRPGRLVQGDRKSTRLNSSHANISYAVFCLKKKIN